MRCMVARPIDLRDASFPFPEQPEQAGERIKKLIHYALFQRNDSIIGNRDAFRTNFGAAFGDVAVTDAMRLLQLLQPLFRVERMHLQGGDMDEKARSDELFLQLMVAQHMANILAKITFDA